MHYILDSETDEWDIKQALKIEGKNYKVQKLNLQLICIIKYDEKIEIERKHFMPNQKRVLMEYLFDEYVENNKKALKIYSHNLDFDIKFIFKQITNSHLIMKPVYKNRLIAMRCFSKSKYKGKNGKNLLKKVFEFRDSFSIIPLSIEKIGKLTGLLKLENSSNMQEKIQYCYRDCQVCNNGLYAITELFSKFEYTTTIEELPLTIPALSIKLFLEKNKSYEIEKELKNGQKIKKNKLFDVSPHLNEYFKRFYYGGKVEIYNFNIMRNCNYYDINSTYQAVMFKSKFPLPNYFKIKTNDESNISTLTFAIEAEINESNEYNPLIPERFIINKQKFIFYLAHKKTCLLFINEYNYLKKRKVPIKINAIWNCEEFVNPFGYMKDIYQIRKKLKKENNPLENLCKLPMNSTYGKFAQSCEIEDREILPLNKIEYEDLLDLVNQRKISNINFELNSYEFVKPKSKTIQLDYVNVIFACLITAEARLNIISSDNEAIEQGYSLTYNDTDSIVSNNFPANLISDELGMFKIEKSFKRFLAISPKEYLFEETTDNIANMQIIEKMSKFKGLKQNSDVNSYINEGIENMRPSKILECNSRKIDITSAISVLKRKQTFYYKRLILPNSLKTIPLHNLNHLNIVKKHNKRIILKQIKKWLSEEIISV